VGNSFWELQYLSRETREEHKLANFQLQDSQKVPYAIAEFDADGNIVAPGVGDSVAVTTSDPASLTAAPDATVDPAKVPANADGTPGNPANYLQTGFLVGGKKAQLGVGATATFTHTDGTKAPPAVTDLLDIVVGPAVTGAISLGAPVSQ
jgi:hypothetical protein